jgi:endoglucanase
MDPAELVALAGRLLSCPVAPFYEAGVRAVVETVCSEHGLDCRRDRYGNVLVHLGDPSVGRPLVLAAHMDHPGFEVVRALGPKGWVVQFNGGVPDAYFRPGLPLRLWPGDIRVRLGRPVGAGKWFEAHAISRRRKDSEPSHKAAPRFGVWDVEEFAVRRGRIHGRACDDLVGVACVLATLIELKRSARRTFVIGVLSRAEEVGFQGALAVAAERVIPKDSLIISLETSRELPPAKMGKGVILRVGDRTSVFDAAAMRFLGEVASGLASATDGRFHCQRALMPGGTCEATAYQGYGYQTGALCVALGNYHNCHPNGSIAAEYVDAGDACSMVELLVAAAREIPAFARHVGRLPAQLDGLLRKSRRRLKDRSE